MKKTSFVFVLTIMLMALSCSKSSSVAEQPTQNTEPEKSSAKSITGFSIMNMQATIVDSTNSITLILPPGTTLNKLAPFVTVSDKATVSPASLAEVDFTNPVVYTVTAENGTQRKYTVRVTNTRRTEKEINLFIINGLYGNINKTNMIITLQMPVGTDITRLAPEINISEGAKVSPASREVINFTNPVSYTVTAEDGSIQKYTVTVTARKSSEKNILSFNLDHPNLSADPYGASADTVIGVFKPTDNSIDFYCTKDAVNGLKKIVPIIKVSDKATISPASGVAQDFNLPVTYTITAEDGSTRTVTVTFRRFDLAYVNGETVKATYLRPDKNSYVVGEEVMVDVTANMYWVLTRSSIAYMKYLSGSTQVSAFRIKKMYSDASRFWFECKETGNFDVYFNYANTIGPKFNVVIK
jgi:hypothetical protein